MGNSSAKSFYNTALPMDWEVLEFGKFAEKEKEKYLPSENENLRCIELEHFEQGTGHISGWINSSEQKSTKNRFTKGQVLFGKLRPYLQKYWLAEYEGVCSSEVWVLNSKNKKCCNEYLYRLVQTNHFIQVANVSSGSKMPRADWDYVASFPFPLPPLPEQKAIANILSMMDAAINKNNQLIIQKELQKKWLMQNLLTGKKRLKGFEEEWKEYHLGEMFFERNETRFIDLQLLSVGANGIYPQADSIS
jgi:type I restriction enzyme S subunit